MLSAGVSPKWVQTDCQSSQDLDVEKGESEIVIKSKSAQKQLPSALG